MFRHIKVGDIVTRNMCDIREQWKVTEVTDERIVIGLGWTFCRDTGAEIDDDLKWGPAYGVTGSCLELEPDRRK